MKKAGREGRTRTTGLEGTDGSEEDGTVPSYLILAFEVICDLGDSRSDDGLQN